MISSLSAEEIFLIFYDLVDNGKINIQPHDWSPLTSFFTKVYNKDQLTRNQANYIEKLLEKYKNVCLQAGFDYTDVLNNFRWDQEFRVLDLSKKLYIETKDGDLEICLKFPYQLKKEFEQEIIARFDYTGKNNYWDFESKVRRLSFYDYNLISIFEFANKHAFTIDDSFLDALSTVEEIWQESENFSPRSEIIDSKICLINANPDAYNFFESNRSGYVIDDALLAKSMGYPLDIIPQTSIEKLISSGNTTFWIKSHETFFSLYKQITGKVCIILDRTLNILDWLKYFVQSADKFSVSREEIKVCFRESKETNLGLNEWIRLAGVGGSVENGRILIFEAKPAKWLFKHEEHVKLLITNNVYPPANNLTKDYLNGHPCVIYLGDTKPTEQRGHKIVEL